MQKDKDLGLRFCG